LENYAKRLRRWFENEFVRKLQFPNKFRVLKNTIEIGEEETKNHWIKSVTYNGMQFNTPDRRRAIRLYPDKPPGGGTGSAKAPVCG
jgi:hypothetical protein